MRQPYDTEKKKFTGKRRKQGISRRLFSLTISKMEVDARFLAAESDVEGSGRSKNSRLGRSLCWLSESATPCPWQSSNGSLSDRKRPFASHKRVEKVGNFCSGCEELVYNLFDVNTEVAWLDG